METPYHTRAERHRYEVRIEAIHKESMNLACRAQIGTLACA